MVAHLGQARAGDQSNITCADNSDLHGETFHGMRSEGAENLIGKK
jgi:hypothetical protein